MSANLPEGSEVGMALQSGAKLGQGCRAFMPPTSKSVEKTVLKGCVTLDKVASPTKAVPTRLSPNQYLGSPSLHCPLTRPFSVPEATVSHQGWGQRLFRRDDRVFCQLVQQKSLQCRCTWVCRVCMCVSMCVHVHTMSGSMSSHAHVCVCVDICAYVRVCVEV